MMVFCTLFDSNYLDKGLVMYRSLVSTGCDFKMYVLAMDEKCKNVLDAYHYENLMTIPIDSFVAEVGLFDARNNRSRAEFCWTCTSFLIDYVLNSFKEPMCTYVDSDLFFYSNPQCLVDEMGNKTVQIVEHRFDNSPEGKLGLAHSGTYCVEFNTFMNSKDAIELLNWWKERCLESCSINKNRGTTFGDQGYLEGWETKPNVSVLRNLGGGVAPWNVDQYRLISEQSKEASPLLKQNKDGEQFNLVFYHFHNIIYYTAHQVNINVYGKAPVDDALIRHLYIPYLQTIDSTKNELRERFNFYPLLTSHPGIKMGKNKKTIGEMIKSVDNLIVAKVYTRTIGAYKRRRDAYKNIIEFGEMP